MSTARLTATSSADRRPDGERVMPSDVTHDSPGPRRRVILADDDVLLREGLAGLLAGSGFEVVRTVGRGDDLMNRARVDRPDLVVVDIRMPPTHTLEGLEAARMIKTELPATAVMVLSAHVEVEHAMDLLAGGEGIGYLLKSRVSAVDEFLEAVERVSRGGSVLDPALVPGAGQSQATGRPPGPAELKGEGSARTHG
jgi:DNA-binding NarL/FixJ family response regulator